MKPVKYVDRFLRKAPLTVRTIAESAPLSGTNRTDAIEIFQKELDNIIVTRISRSKETGQCHRFYLLMRPSVPPGMYGALYQAAPHANFEYSRSAFLSFDPITMTSVGLSCRNLPNSKFQIEVVVLSTFKSRYDEATQEAVRKILESNNLGYINMVRIEHNNRCLVP
ncbi:uncharacterized protein LOC123297493 [Chrysoperla carnea]|uniref:uncharacterized protein LOC123297493 n=1 Tax=Chrysoperla carnea TaxID=189513 RepID=UPI001D070F0E|nr:uncharacterized protein LOC123297493 [Chrysoperla carnea]